MKTVRFRDTRIDFQDACLHCLGWARETYTFERTFFFGRQSILLQIPAPLCSQHLRRVKMKSLAQICCDRIGLIVSAIIGLATCAGLLYVWSVNGQGTSVLNILLAILVGFSIFITTWTMAHFWITPLFASAETRAMINSLRITKYDAVRQFLELTFTNDTAAELARRANLDILAEDLTDFKRFEISAHILSHDIRLSANVKTVVPLDHAPSLKEARELLQPAIELVMARNLGEGCFYDIDSLEIHELS